MKLVQNFNDILRKLGTTNKGGLILFYMPGRPPLTHDELVEAILYEEHEAQGGTNQISIVGSNYMNLSRNGQWGYRKHIYGRDPGSRYPHIVATFGQNPTDELIFGEEVYQELDRLGINSCETDLKTFEKLEPQLSLFSA